MRFFTLDWFREAEEDEDFIPIFARYTQHLEEMRSVLPPEVLELAVLPGVDDGLIVEVHHVRSQEMLLLIMRCGDFQMGYYDLVLTYEGAKITPEHEWTLARLARSTKDAWHHASDVAYHEVDHDEDGLIHHRLLFHPGLWFEVRCRALRWERVARPGRRLPQIGDRFPGGPTSPPSRIKGWRKPESPRNKKSSR